MLDLFTPQVPLERCHPNFLGYMARPQSHRDEMLAWSDGFVDRDGKFVIEFQTTFNAAFWELYVFACLKQMGFTVDFSYPAPDFVVLRDGQPAFCIEAVVASNANDGTPEWQRDWKTGREVDLAKVTDDATIRFANSITSKYEKYRTSYSTIPVIGKLPFVLAVAPFDQPWFFKESVYPPLRVLYGIDPRHWQGEEPPQLMPNIKKANGADVPLGYFVEPTMPEISAVMFSNVATVAKVAALAKDDPNYRSYFVGVQRMDGKGDRVTQGRIPKAEHKESLLDGLHLFHNPKANYHFPRECFEHEGTAQWGCEIATRTPFRTGTPDILLQRASLLMRIKKKKK